MRPLASVPLSELQLEVWWQPPPEPRQVWPREQYEGRSHLVTTTGFDLQGIRRGYGTIDGEAGGDNHHRCPRTDRHHLAAADQISGDAFTDTEGTMLGLLEPQGRQPPTHLPHLRRRLSAGSRSPDKGYDRAHHCPGGVPIRIGSIWTRRRARSGATTSTRFEFSDRTETTTSRFEFSDRTATTPTRKSTSADHDQCACR